MPKNLTKDDKEGAAAIEALEHAMDRIRAIKTESDSAMRALKTLQKCPCPEGFCIKQAIRETINTCKDVTHLGYFSPIIDPVRWVEELQAHLEESLAKIEDPI